MVLCVGQRGANGCNLTEQYLHTCFVFKATYILLFLILQEASREVGSYLFLPFSFRFSLMVLCLSALLTRQSLHCVPVTTYLGGLPQACACQLFTNMPKQRKGEAASWQGGHSDRSCRVLVTRPPSEEESSLPSPHTV